MEIIAAPLHGSGRPSTRIHLRVWSIDSDVFVSEKEIGSAFPAACPERHINYGGSFCLGLRTGRGLSKDSQFKLWWRDLREFLLCQEFAERQGRWPPGKGLSHGNAAYHQLCAEAAAKEIVSSRSTAKPSIIRLAGFQDAYRLVPKTELFCPLGAHRVRMDVNESLPQRFFDVNANIVKRCVHWFKLKWIGEEPSAISSRVSRKAALNAAEQ